MNGETPISRPCQHPAHGHSVDGSWRRIASGRGLVHLLATFSLVGCTTDRAIEQGSLGASCYPNATCNLGLDCYRGLCVSGDDSDVSEPDARTTDAEVDPDSETTSRPPDGNSANRERSQRS